jgi:hypothetical protein
MNLIERDLMAAGSGMGPWTQVFTPALDATSAVVGPSGANADTLQFLAHAWDCRDLPVDCSGGSCYNGSNLRLSESLAGAGTCYSTTRLVFVAWSDPALGPTTLGNGEWSGKWGVGVKVVGGGAAAIGSAPANDGMSFASAQPATCVGTTMTCSGSTDFVTGAPPYSGKPTVLLPLSLIRYEVANDTDGTPALFRSEVGGSANADGSGAYAAASATGATWQLVARGIEDMQIVYISRGNGTQTTPGAKTSSNVAPTILVSDLAAPDDYSKIVTEVRVTLGARTLAVASATGGTPMSGQLTRTVTIPSALAAFRSVPSGSVSYGNQWR